MPLHYGKSVSFARRIGAALLDALLFLFLSAIVRGIVLIASGADAEEGRALLQTLQPLFLGSIPLIIPLAWLLFQGTPGKLLLDCRLIDAHSGDRPSVWQVLLRFVGYALSALPAGLGFFWMLWDKQGQTWHDKLSRTRVVSDDAAFKSLRQLQLEWS